MKKRITLGLIIIFGSIAIFAYLLYQKQMNETLPEAVLQNDQIRVKTPKLGDKITSPLEIKGEARGPWFFEADFPVQVLDKDGNALNWGIAQAGDNWMTPDFVPFTATVEFESPGEGFGFVQLEKDNPSGLPEHAGFIKIPVRF